MEAQETREQRHQGRIEAVSPGRRAAVAVLMFLGAASLCLTRLPQLSEHAAVGWLVSGLFLLVAFAITQLNCVAYRRAAASR